MSDLAFEWDEKKNISNQRKHGVSFDEAKTAFTDQFARLIPAPDHSDHEDRFVLVGTSIHSRLLVVCHCIRKSEMIRIISARKADRQERNSYEGYRNA